VGQLDQRSLEEVEDIICNPPTEGKYQKVKEQLIKRLWDSDAARVRKLLENEEVGDRTPTQFWHHLKTLAGNSVDNNFLIEMWQNRLPSQTQRILMCISDRDMPKLAEIADQIYAIPAEKGYIVVSSTAASTTATTPDTITTICEQIQKLQRQMN
jgi:hypothetical protein